MLSIMHLDVTDPEGAYRRHVAEQVGAALKRLYEPVVAEALPPQHRALLAALQAQEDAAEQSRDGR